MKKNKPEQLQQARVLGGFTLDGLVYQSDDIIEAHPDIIESLGTAVDTDHAAVDYCLNKTDSVIKRCEWIRPEPSVEETEATQ